MKHTLSVEQLVILNNIQTGINNQVLLGGIPKPAHMIQNHEGSFGGCLRLLTSFHRFKAHIAWFADHNLDEFKRQCWVSTKLKNIYHTMIERSNMATEETCLYGILSDHEPAIQWLTSLEPSSKAVLSMIHGLKDPFYRHYQATLALRGDWVQLAERAKCFLADVPKGMKRFAADQRFYLALAQGNRQGMESALLELTEPKLVKARSESLLPFVDFIANHATLYAKIAWRHGFELSIDTPMIPREWLPVSPLAHYPDPYDFMREYSFEA